MKMYEKLDLFNGKVQGSMFAIDNVNTFVETRIKLLAERGIKIQTVRRLNTSTKDAMPVEVFALCDNSPCTEFPRYIAFYR
jgi:hypothetical protein